ncbi:PREDICTED: MATH domain and coiled-coil domain-containing protein At3g58340-like [Camelina sativa]|uniref:MATH domain and coiled-coil domain-containing protein At3g58340-like n=1 Tax=Camelina sativa TaxID=90675 RepID=A0ABM0SL77_CAMSA|nr:PREDICTED: MATH domain and coiled-coil domain-containing protein At3g58340-like [Camelina sativa]
MAAKGDYKKFCWEINNFSSLKTDERCYSVPVMIGDLKWRLFSIIKGCKADYLSVNLEVAHCQPLPSGWRRYVKFSITVVNQRSQQFCVQKETQRWFEQDAPGWGFAEMLPLTKLNANDSGFLVDGHVMIAAEIEVLEVIGTLDESEESVQSNDKVNKTQEVKESIDVNGFQVLPSQVESVRRIFEKHPDIAVGFQVKNQHLRKTFMNFLVNVIETLCQSLQELSNEDLVEIDIGLTYLKDAGFKVDWLEKKLDQVKEKKEKEQSGLVILQGIEKQLHDLMHKCETKKSEVLSIGAPLKFDDVV